MMINQEKLRELLECDPSTGIFRWKDRRHNSRKVGTEAGWNDVKGKNWKIWILGKQYLAHRLVWFFVHGYWPNQIDHINGNRLDNRLSNLREANNSQNQANMKAKSNSHLGIRGVGIKDGVYIVQLYKTEGNKKIKIIKRFKTLDEATEFSIAKSKELHGEFSIYSRSTAMQ